MANAAHDLIVIGAGPGGYVAAIRAAQLGWNVGLIEKEAQLGGTCLRVGCIPSKSLLESTERYREAVSGLEDYGVLVQGARFDLAKMQARKTQVVAGLAKGIEGLLKKRKVTRYLGLGTILAPGKVTVTATDGTATEVTAKNILIATGSRVAELKGVEFNGTTVTDSDAALSYDQVPGHLVVIGAGAIGLELGSVWARLGAKVTVLEYLDRILPGMDRELAESAQKLFAKQGLEFKLGVQVTGVRVTVAGGAGVEVLHSGGEPIVCDKVLVAVGRKPNTAGVGLANVKIDTDARGRIPVDAHYQTKVPGIFAIGDVIAGPMLAHKAEEEGVACVEQLITGYGHVNYDAIPAIVYTHPEVATVGKTEEELQKAGVAYKKGAFSFVANGRARALGQWDGRAIVLADATTDRVLGVHVLGPRAGDLIAEAAVAIEFGASSEDLARTCHAHPTLAEVLKEAAMAVSGRAIHA